MSSEAYLSRGVSPTKDEVKQAVAHQAPGLLAGAFCKVLAHPTDSESCVLLHADGAGTKSILAYLAYREGASASIFAGLAQDATVMNTDDLLCMGATGPFLLSNTIGRNAQRIPGEVLAAVIQGYDDFLANMQQQGIDIIMAGGETADVGDLVQTLICDSTIYVQMPRHELVNTADLAPGQAIVALASAGSCAYEDKENSGIASNGLTLARHVLLSSYYRDRYPEAWASSMDPSKAYCGCYRLEDPLPGSTLTVGEALLSPTRTFLPVVKRILAEEREHVHAMIHNTGGALTKCLNFGQGIRYVKDQLFPRPAIFEAIAASGQVSEKEMYQDFNLGQRLELYCDPEAVERIVAIAACYGLAAKQIGYTEKSSVVANELLIQDRGQTYRFGGEE